MNLCERWPDHRWASGNLISLYWRTGRMHEEVQLAVEQAKRRPNDFASNENAWRELRALGDGRASEYATRARNLLTPAIQETEASAAVELESAAFDDALTRRNLAKALVAYEELVKRFPPRIGNLREVTLFRLAYEAGNLGRLHEFERWMQEIKDPGERARLQADLSEMRHDPATVRKALKKQSALRAEIGPIAIVRMSRFGLVHTAEQFLKGFFWRLTPSKASMVTGEIALAKGDTHGGIRELEKSLAVLRPDEVHTAYELYAAIGLAKALDNSGTRIAAIQTLQDHSQSPVHLACEVLAKLELLRLLHQQGDGAAAKKVVSDLREDLKYADPDHPALRILAQKDHLHGLDHP